jgi:hypothetical protein
MGGAGQVNGVSGVTMYPVLGTGGKGGLDRTVGKGIFHGFKTTEGVLKALDSLGQAVTGDGIGLITKLKFLL